MIVLGNGDKWILDGFELKKNKGKQPKLMSVKEFIEEYCKHSNEYIPQKWNIESSSGYWTANYNVFQGVFKPTSTRSIDNPWSMVFEMPWKSIIVVFIRPDNSGHGAVFHITVFKNYKEYLKSVHFDRLCKHFTIIYM